MFIRRGRRSPTRTARHARSHPRESRRRWRRGGDEAGEGISANYLNQSKIAHVRCIERHGETIVFHAAADSMAERRIDSVDFHESRSTGGHVGGKGTRKAGIAPDNRWVVCVLEKREPNCRYRSFAEHFT